MPKGKGSEEIEGLCGLEEAARLGILDGKGDELPVAEGARVESGENREEKGRRKQRFLEIARQLRNGDRITFPFDMALDRASKAKG